MILQMSPSKAIEKVNLAHNDILQQQQQQQSLRSITNINQISKSNQLTNSNQNNLMTLNNANEQTNQQILLQNQINSNFGNQKTVNNNNNINPNSNNVNAPANTTAGINNIELKENPDLYLSQADFEKKFTKTADKCLNKCDFYETWKYEMNNDLYIVKKYLKLDDMKQKKLVNSYNLQYHLACSNSQFLKPYKLVAFSVTIASTHHNRLTNNPNSHQGGHQNQNYNHQGQNTQGGQQQQNQRRWHLYVIYPFSHDNISLERIYQCTTATISDIDIIYMAFQLFRIGELCAEKNFPLINWKFSNLLIQLKQESISLLNPQQPQQSIQTNLLKSQRQTNNIQEQPSPLPPGQNIQIIEQSLKIMDLYDYFGIENRDSNDQLLPPELRQDHRKAQSTVHFEDYHGNLEQSSIYMTGMMLALFLRKIHIENKKGDNQQKQNKPLQKSLAAASLPSQQSKKSNNFSFTADETKRKEKGLLSSTINPELNSVIINNAQINPLIHALAMIVKVTIDPNPKERPTFSSALDVLRNLFGEIIDDSFFQQPKYNVNQIIIYYNQINIYIQFLKFQYFWIILNSYKI